MYNWRTTFLAKFNWLELGGNIGESLLYILGILIIARLFYSFVVFLLRRAFTRKGRLFANSRKFNTLFPLLRSIAFYLITFAVLLNILKHVFSFDTGTLLASAGVLGVALGFGSQSLVKDVIGGFFILFEDQFSVGEYVKVGQFSGIVEEVGLRATRLRDWGGELHIIPNGYINAATNYNRGKMRALVDVQIPYDEDIDRAIEVIHAVCEDTGREYTEKIIEAPAVQGIIQFGEQNVILRVIAFTKPNEQWQLERELRRRIYKAILQERIRISQTPDNIGADTKTIG
ncbi:MAG TPA: mechanosensitive ion channel family protein [Desulfitobacteriaceae bacterium]|nr:mechanosensitive ion channel family protein [Desulfitobacteriaceae bacterium]